MRTKPRSKHHLLCWRNGFTKKQEQLNLSQRTANQRRRIGPRLTYINETNDERASSYILNSRVDACPDGLNVQVQQPLRQRSCPYNCPILKFGCKRELLLSGNITEQLGHHLAAIRMLSSPKASGPQSCLKQPTSRSRDARTLGQEQIRFHTRWLGSCTGGSAIRCPGRTAQK